MNTNPQIETTPEPELIPDQLARIYAGSASPPRFSELPYPEGLEE